MTKLAQQNLLLVLGIFSLMVSVWFLSSWNLMLDHYHSMAALPFVYGCALIILSRCPYLNLFKTVTICSYSIKLLITPWFITTIGLRELQKGLHFSVYNHIPEAVLLQVFEVIAVSILLFTLPNYKNIDNINFSVKPIRQSWRLLLFICFLGFALVAIYPQLLYKFQPIFADKEVYYALQDLSSTVKGSMNLYVYHLGVWIVTLTKLLLVYVLIYLLNRTTKCGNWLILLFSFIVVFVSCLFTTSDRAATIYTAIVGLLLIYKIYPKYRDFISRFSVVSGIIGIFFIFLYGSIFKADNVASEVGYKLNAYFSGTINVAACFEMNKANLIETFIGDALRNIPLVMGFFTHLPMSYLEFNRALGYDVIYNSQILPVIGQGYFYLGIFGSVLFPIIMLKIAYCLYNRIQYARDSFEYFAYMVAFIYTFLGVNLYDMFLTMGLVLQYGVPMLLISYFAYMFKKIKI